jgi:hypothetical protein
MESARQHSEYDPFQGELTDSEEIDGVFGAKMESACQQSNSDVPLCWAPANRSITPVT